MIFFSWLNFNFGYSVGYNVFSFFFFFTMGQTSSVHRYVHVILVIYLCVFWILQDLVVLEPGTKPTFAHIMAAVRFVQAVYWN